MTWPERRLGRIARLRVSNVDKLSRDDGTPVRLCNYVDVYKNEAITNDLDFMQATATPAQIASFRLSVGDTIFTKDSETADDIGVPTYVAETSDDLICGYHLAIATPDRTKVDPRFLFWAMSSGRVRDQWTVLASGVTRVGLRSDDLGKAGIPVPPLDEQRRIADFLDTETALLDSVQRLRDEQLALLECREAAALTEVLDDPTVRRVRLGYLATLQSGVTVGGTRPSDGLIERPYLRVANVKEDRLELDSVTTIRVTPQEARASHLRPGDVLMTEGGDLDKLGRGTVWRGEIPGCLHQNHVFALRCGARLLPEYLSYFTRAAPARGYFRETGVKTTNLASTNSTKVRILPVPLPSVTTQRERVELIERVLRQSGDLRTLLDRQASLVAERRQALITAAVTGQLDVTTARGGYP